MRHSLLALVTGFCIFALSAPALACKCKTETRGESYESSNVAFYGEVIGVEDGLATFKVSKAFKKTKRKRKVKITQSGSNCDNDFKEGESWIVFASKTGKKKKAKYSASRCSGSKKLEFTPLSAIVWSLSDQPTYGVTKREGKKYQKSRNKLSDHAMKTLRSAVKKCDKGIWKSKKNVSGHIEVRFDHVEGRMFDAAILKYTTQRAEADKEAKGGDTKVPDAAAKATHQNNVRTCLKEKLTEVKFPKFSGGPISIHAYLLLDQIDPMMSRKKGGAQVVEFKTEKFD